jgi:hypothetical protein
MLPKDKYTVFDRKVKRYRKGIHSTYDVVEEEVGGLTKSRSTQVDQSQSEAQPAGFLDGLFAGFVETIECTLCASKRYASNTALRRDTQDAYFDFIFSCDATVVKRAPSPSTERHSLDFHFSVLWLLSIYDSPHLQHVVPSCFHYYPRNPCDRSLDSHPYPRGSTGSSHIKFYLHLAGASFAGGVCQLFHVSHLVPTAGAVTCTWPNLQSPTNLPLLATPQFPNPPSPFLASDISIYIPSPRRFSYLTVLTTL